MKLFATLALCLLSIHSFSQLTEDESTELKTLLKKFKRTHDDFYNFDTHLHKQATSGMNKSSMYCEIRDTSLFIIAYTVDHGSLFGPKSVTVKIDSTFYTLRNPVNYTHNRYSTAVNETMYFRNEDELAQMIAQNDAKKSISIRFSNDGEYRDGQIFVKNIIAWKETYRLYELLKKKGRAS